MKHFLFYEEITGENFIICCDNLGDACDLAVDIARDIMEYYNNDEPDLIFIDELTEAEAEASGYDEY